MLFFLFEFIRSIFRSRNESILTQYQKIVDKINFFESVVQLLSLEELSHKTIEFKRKISLNFSVELMLPEVFAVVREISRRILNMRHYDVQLLGGICLYYGNIVEMQTGEGKTLVAILPVYVTFLCNKKVHVVTVNDYLAERDANWMSPVYTLLGLTVSVLTNLTSLEKRKNCYMADVVYGTNNEFGFDYLRDNMVFSSGDIVQNDLFFAIIDEVDSVLIDEARTPLVISSSHNEYIHTYKIIDKIISNFLNSKDFIFLDYYTIDEKLKLIYLTEHGYKEFEKILKINKLLLASDSLYSEKNIWLIYHIQLALKAYILLQCNVDYIVKDGKVCIIDEHTGRILQGRCWSGGIHQAVEAKENVEVQQENKTLASITFQNYFRLYKKLAGMTGTAFTEAPEFQFVYNLEVIVIPPNKKCIRIDYPDLVYLTNEEKYYNIIYDVLKRGNNFQPVLIGTVSIEVSEYLSLLFKKKKIIHNVLNAKFHEKEAFIISEAGKPGNVTIATNMAGRGTDIILGGRFDGTDIWLKSYKLVKESGGLHVIGTERHEARRIDNQLRGRAGRQGDPGSSCFYLSLQDNLMKIFLSSKLSELFKKLWIEKNKPLTNTLVTKSIENAQKKVEGYYSDVRKQLLEFDNILNEQRVFFFQKRRELVNLVDICEFSYSFMYDVLLNLFSVFHKDDFIINFEEFLSICNLLEKRYNILMVDAVCTYIKVEKRSFKTIFLFIYEKFKSYYILIRNKYQKDVFCLFEKKVLLSIFDFNWYYHLENIEYVRETIYLRSYAQKDPKQEYKKEIFSLFLSMVHNIKEDFIIFLFNNLKNYMVQ